jgi:hypothetical protein
MVRKDFKENCDAVLVAGKCLVRSKYDKIKRVLMVFKKCSAEPQHKNDF